MVRRRLPCVTAGSTLPGVHRGSGSWPWSRKVQWPWMVPVTRRGSCTRSRAWCEEPWPPASWPVWLWLGLEVTTEMLRVPLWHAVRDRKAATEASQAHAERRVTAAEYRPEPYGTLDLAACRR